jgi:formylglycine-generating enzyme required for sulfatase activity
LVLEYQYCIETQTITGDFMSPIAALWQTIETQYTNGSFPDDQMEKIDELVFSEAIENIRNGLTLMTPIAPEYLCRYLELDGESMVLRDAGRFDAPLSVERVLVESAKSELMWSALYESGAFESMHFRALGDVDIENLSESEKAFCVRMAKEMVRVPTGDFMMGALEDDGEAYDHEKPRHKVTFTKDFMIGKYAVTQGLWESVMGSNPSGFKGANRPVECVSWFDCVLFCNKLSELEGLDPVYEGLGDYQVGVDQNMDEDEIEALSAAITCNWTAKGYRLPTEAEWEYRARGGEYHKYAGSDNVDEVAWYDGNSGYETYSVGQKKPNGFGLYDMSGNVWEWVWDWWGDDYSTETSTNVSVENQLDSTENQLGSIENPTGNPIGSRRVNRGGSWFSISELVRTSYRYNYDPTYQGKNFGFRICRFT